MNEKNIFIVAENVATVTEKLQQGNKEELGVFDKIWNILGKKPFYDLRKTDIKNDDEFFDKYLVNGKLNSFYNFLKNQVEKFGNVFIPAHLSMTGKIVSYYKD